MIADPLPPPTGLSAKQAAQRLRESGPNELRPPASPSPARILARQFRGTMIYLLLAATGVSAVLGEGIDAVAIAVIVLLNAGVGFVQEYRAEGAVAALARLSAPRARVRRDGRVIEVAAREVVRGDVLLLEPGDIVAADTRLLHADALAIGEAILTGESFPVDKYPDPVPVERPLSERHDHAFAGTSVARGSGYGEVVATGMHTQMGQVAGLLQHEPPRRTPLQIQLDHLGRVLVALAFAVVLLTAGIGVWRGDPWLEVLLTATSLAVAAVPEGLPVFITLALALGVQRMAQQRVLVRRLPAIETMGCTTIICTDKTGTLTHGSMRLRETWGDDEAVLLDAAAACCDAELDADDNDGTGDPTEVAILIAAAARGIHRADIEAQRPRRSVQPFDADTKCMSIERADGQVYLKGAVEAVVDRCAAPTHDVGAANRELAAKGLRVLAVASGAVGGALHFRGLIGLADPPRNDATEAIARARQAGIRTIMITGDHPITAEAIAREMGILGPQDDPSEVVVARASPQQKLELVRRLQADGEVVAMTGDGVNDAPALRVAHVGVAMGKGGTEVAREAAAVVLADDNYASIVAGVREGRGVFDNIRKTLVYLLAGNVGELALVFAAAIAFLPLPLTPVQILWINLVTDGMPALALIMDPTSRDVLAKPPRSPREPILSAPQWRTIMVTGLLEGTLGLGAFVWMFEHYDLATARTFTFTVLVFAELLRAFSARSGRELAFEAGFFSNPRLLLVVVVSAAAQLVILQIDAVHRVFSLCELTWPQIAAAFGLGLVPVTILELGKLLRRLLSTRSAGAPSSTGDRQAP